MEKFIKMEIREIQTTDDPRNPPIIVLAESDGEREFPIFIGHIEARTLEEAALAQVSPVQIIKRPFAHDLVLNTLDELDGTLTRVLITKLENSTFYGALEITSSAGGILRVDSRPSDALILAVKRAVPIFVEEQVMRDVHDSDDSDDHF